MFSVSCVHLTLLYCSQPIASSFFCRNAENFIALATLRPLLFFLCPNVLHFSALTIAYCYFFLLSKRRLFRCTCYIQTTVSTFFCPNVLHFSAFTIVGVLLLIPVVQTYSISLHWLHSDCFLLSFVQACSTSQSLLLRHT